MGLLERRIKYFLALIIVMIVLLTLTIQMEPNTTYYRARSSFLLQQMAQEPFQVVPGPPLPISKQLTMVMMVHKRIEVLSDSYTLRELVPLNIVHELIIVWNNFTDRSALTMLQEKLQRFHIQSKVRMHFPKTGSLNNRFYNVPDIKTDCVFYLDDQWYMSTANFREGFKHWQNAPDRLVGQLPGLINYEPTVNGLSTVTTYAESKFKVSIREYGFNVVLPSGGMYLHKKYLDLYSSERVKPARDLVDQLYSSEDLLLNFIVPPQNQPPILFALNGTTSKDYLRSILRLETPESSKTYSRKRAQSVRPFVDLFGFNLITSRVLLDLPSDHLVASAETNHSSRNWRQKYMVGCNNSTGLTVNWTELVSTTSSRSRSSSSSSSMWDQILSEAPNVVLFCNHSQMSDFALEKLKARGTRIALYVPNLSMFNSFQPAALQALFKVLDVIVTPQAYRVEHFFSSESSLHLPLVLWIPPGAAPEFAETPLNQQPMQQILVLDDKQDKLIEYILSEADSGGILASSKSLHTTRDDRIREFHSYFAVLLSTGVVDRNLGQHVFEILASGALLLINRDLEAVLNQLGLRNNEHFISYDDADPRKKIDEVYQDRNNFDTIRSEGLLLARQQHLFEHRRLAIDAYFETGKVTYHVPQVLSESACPNAGYSSEADCNEAVAKFTVRVEASVGYPGPKYYVGCNPEGWKQYVRPEYYYLFHGLEEDYGWQHLFLDTTQDGYALLREPPNVILFCENHVNKRVYLPKEQLKAAGTQLALFADDTHFYNGFSEEQITQILVDMDVILSPYAYRLHQYFETVPISRMEFPTPVWIPHAASPTFTSVSFNDMPIRQVFLSGSIGLKSYPIREWLYKHFQPQNKNMMVTYHHPGYNKLATNQSEIYARHIRAYHCAITTTMVFRRLVAKVFEIPATGSLLLVNDDLRPMLAALGMEHMKHYIAFDETYPDPEIGWVEDPQNFDQVDRIRKAGMDQVRKFHTVANRAEALDAYFTTGEILYKFPMLHKDTPCPNVGYETTEECVQAFDEKARSYHYTVPKNQPWPLRPENQPVRFKTT